MTLYDFVKKNKTLVKRLIRAGVMSYKIMKAYEVYEDYKKMGGDYDASIWAADKHNISDRTVWRYVKLMKENL